MKRLALLPLLGLFLFVEPAAACYPSWVCEDRYSPTENNYDALNRQREGMARQREMDRLRFERDQAERDATRMRALDAQRRSQEQRDPSGLYVPHRSRY